MDRFQRIAGSLRGTLLAVTLLAGGWNVSSAQVTPAAGSTPPDDTPLVKVGGVIFADYTYQDSPEKKIADGSSYHPTSFNVGRAYVNVTGNISHRISYRITPDIKQETKVVGADGKVADINGSYVFRLKYAYGQFNLDDWLPKGSWTRLGMQQTPLIDYTEQIYRYRFQGTIYPEREGYLTSSDAGLSGRFTFPHNYGDVHFGYYNGDGYSKVEANNEKSFQIRASLRPAPMTPVVKGLRVAGFWDKDAPVSGGKRDRLVGQVTFEHPRVNAGLDYLEATDKATSTSSEVKGKGWSVWATPKLVKGWELLLRYDDLEPDTSKDATKNRVIGGVSYWFPVEKGVSAALLIDYDRAQYDGVSPSLPDDTKYALHALISF
jgi:hypothetical protein